MFVQPPSKSHCSIKGAPCSIMNNGDFLWEVLVFLPTKSLMRFKSVSKLWYSIIRNHKFAIAHNNRGSGGGCFHGLLINRYDTFGIAQGFFYANFNNPPILMQCQMTIPKPNFTFTIVVNGLIGLYKYGHNVFTLCNIATHELRNLPPSPFYVGSTKPFNDFKHYLLGFDRSNDVYKVLNIWTRLEEEDNFKGKFKCNLKGYIFTLGVNNSDMQWRNIAPPPIDLYFEPQKCLCISGALYWLPNNKHGKYQRTLLVFHLNSETFETIAIPEYIQGGYDLVEICGSPSLIVVNETCDYDKMLDIWTIKNHCKGDELEAWSRKKVLLPTSLNQTGPLNYVGTLPTGDKMLLGQWQSHNFPLPIYIYDHLKNELNLITIEGYESPESGLDVQENGMALQRMKICYYEENIISLDCLLNNQPKDQLI